MTFVYKTERPDNYAWNGLMQGRVLYNAVDSKLNKPHVLGVLAGGDFPLDRLAKWANSADKIIAADGGANSLKLLGLIPETTIGDLDSISPESSGCQLELIQIEDQNCTDCDKLLALAAQRGIRHITLICVEGDLFDHMLGTLFSAASSELNVQLVLRRGLAHVLRGPIDISFMLPEATRLSLMPLTECEDVGLEGTHWPLSRARLNPLGLTSLSNRAAGQVRLRFASGAAVLFLIHTDFESVVWTGGIQESEG